MQAVIPMMRKQGGGIIVNITSVGGRITFSLNSPYHATKFALEGLSESMQYELEPLGIKIIVIEPGGVGSNFLKNLKMASNTSDSLNSPYRSIQSSISIFQTMVTKPNASIRSCKSYSTSSYCGQS